MLSQQNQVSFKTQQQFLFVLEWIKANKNPLIRSFEGLGIESRNQWVHAIRSCLEGTVAVENIVKSSQS